MATKFQVKTTFEAARTIEPIYTGGDVSANASGSLIATTVDEDVLIVNTSSNRPLCRIEGDGEAVTSLSLGPEASYVAICSRSLSMRIFSLDVNDEQTAATAVLLRSLKAHTTPVVSSSIDPTESLLATGAADGAVKIWDLKGGFTTHTFHAHGGVVSAICFFRLQLAQQKRKGVPINQPASSLGLATGGEEGKIRVWDLAASKAVASLDAHASVVRSLCFSQHEGFLLSASRDKTIILWDARTWQQRKVIPVLEVVETSGLLLNGAYCFGGGENGNLRLWSTSTGKEITPKQEPGLETDSIVTAVSISAESLILTIHQDQTMKFHSYSQLSNDVPKGASCPLPVVRRKTANLDEVIDMACVGPDRSTMALAINTESIKLVSADGSSSASVFGNDTGSLDGHTDIIISLDTDWSGHWLATGAKDNTARLWRLDPTNSTFQCAAVFEGHAESIGAVALPKSPPSGNAAKHPSKHFPAFLITGSQDKTIKRWDTSKLKVNNDDAVQSGVRAIYTRVAHEKDINAIDVSPIGPLFASASQDRTIKIWSLEDGSVTGILRGHKRGVWSIKFSPAGTPPIALAEGGASSSRGLLVSGSGDKTVKVWSLSTYTCLLTFEGHSNSVLKVIWLPPLDTDATTSDDDIAHRKTHSQHPTIASSSADTLIKLWDPYAPSDSDNLLTTLDNHSDRVWALATPCFPHSTAPTPPPYPLISGAADATLTFWADTTTQTSETVTRQATERIEQDQLLQNHIMAKNYREVITLSLALNHPGRLLRVFQDVVALPAAEQEPGSLTGVRAVDDVLASLDEEQVFKLLERVRDWNTNARTAVVAQRVLGTLLRSYDVDFFVDLAENRRLKGVRPLLRALEVYTERHYKRLEELVDESYLLEYTLREMDEISGTAMTRINGSAKAVTADAAMV
ncbi:uncharacterized protein HMPREF1541_06515 [Cyphellophora europaea CBS 101466]|uniref:U3 small nucleolar RNA-associated protein 13 C-terminal domain-containing protein n=1 Tax=Cyphellophora europaea (strain CBS 101466) TaxID=1220924 RepID=W2RQ92_CYPE1|nr:uncharacterized protein HMPREF1541_06515 [Cyphellophora europaea CBS 101466]ETN38480.1 hypothetical protein HMPREF1541_06515 [Cyphellophora europaea CBS 101466]